LKRRALRWLARFGLAVLALVVLAVGVGLIAIHTDWGREQIRRRVEAIAGETLPGLRIGRLDGSLLGDFELHDVSLAAVEGGSFARAKRVRVNLGLLALLGKTARVDTLEIDGLELVLPRTPALIPDDEPATWSVEIPALAVRDARIAIEGDAPITLAGVTLTGAFASAPRAPLRVDAHATGTWRERALPLDATVALRVGERVEVPSVRVTLGELRVTGSRIVVDGVRTTGEVEVAATPRAVAALVPQVRLPAAVALQLAVTPAGSGRDERVELAGSLGDATVHGTLVGDPEARTARGVITASARDAGVLHPALAGAADATIAIVADRARVRGTVIARGAGLDLAPAHALVGFDATRAVLHALVIAAGDGEARVAAVAEIARTETPATPGVAAAVRYELVDGAIVASVRDAAVTSVGRVPVGGLVRVVARAHGPIGPSPDLRVSGTVAGDRLAYDDVRVGRVRATLGGRVRHALEGWVKVTATGIRKAGAPIGAVTVDARTRDGRVIAVDVEARPAAVDVVVAARATVTLPATPHAPIAIDLDAHRVRAASGQTWAGEGGRIVIGDDRITFTALRSRSGEARVAADGSYATATRTLRLDADARALSLATIDPALRGVVGGKVSLRKRGLRWDGTAQVTATGVALDPELPVVDGEVGVELAGRRVRLDARVSGPQVGGAHLVLDLDGPRDLTDGRAWKRLDRAAVRAALVGVQRVDLAKAGVEAGGIVDGELVLAGPKTSGTFTLRGLRSPLGAVDGDITFAPMDQGELSASSTMRIAGIGDADVAARIVFPARPFDPAEWKRLGRGVVRVLTASIEDVAIDPARLAKLGIDAPYRARADVSLALAAGLGEAKATVDLREVSGGVIARPLDLHIDASVDGTGTTASARVRRASKQAWTDDGPHLVKLAGSVPMPFERWLATPRDVQRVALTGTIDVPRAQIRDLLALIGRTDVERGTLGGTITLAGTPLAPIASGELVARDVQVKPRLAGREVPLLTELRVGGSWRDGIASAQIVGTEAGGAKLGISLNGSPARLETVTGKIAATRFDIAPITVFLPGPLVAATGTLDANVTITGLHLDGTIRGTLALTKGRMPLTPTIGTLRDANLTAAVDARGFTGKLTGKIGRGTIEANATGDAALRTFQLTGKVRRLTPIGEIEPEITADVRGTLRRERDRLIADARVFNGTVVVTPRDGVELLDEVIPEDLKIGPARAEPEEPRIARTARKPWFVANVALDTTSIDAEREYVHVRGKFRAPRLVVSISDEIAIDGTVEIERGDVEVVGRQYRVEPGPDKLRFDSSRIPTLALRIVHEFPTMTLIADIGGTPIAPTLTMSSQPGIYSPEESPRTGSSRTSAASRAATRIPTTRRSSTTSASGGSSRAAAGAIGSAATSSGASAGSASVHRFEHVVERRDEADEICVERGLIDVDVAVIGGRVPRQRHAVAKRRVVRILRAGLEPHRLVRGVERVLAPHPAALDEPLLQEGPACVLHGGNHCRARASCGSAFGPPPITTCRVADRAIRARQTVRRGAEAA